MFFQNFPFSQNQRDIKVPNLGFQNFSENFSDFALSSPFLSWRRRYRSKAMAAQAEIPVWMTCPMRATKEEKERHAQRRKETEDKLIPQFENLCKENGIDLSDFGSDEGQKILLGRFLRARRYQVEDALQMIQEHIQWRKEYEVTRLRSPENHGDAFPQLKGYWPGELHGVDRDGVAVYYERVGALDPTSLLKQLDKEDVIRYHVYKQEESMDDIMAKAIERGEYKGRVAVMDLHGLGWKHMHKEGLSLLKQVIRIDESNYPEVLKRLFIIRAPNAFTAIWKGVKPWLDERTLAKIEICGYDDFLDALQLEVDLDQIPEIYGGKYSCTFDPKKGGIFCGKWDGSPKTMDVGRADSAEISVDGVEGQTIDYEFQTVGYDISFGVFFVEEGKSEKKAVKKNEKVNSHQVAVKGTYTFPSPGRVILFFDNTFSWTRGKTVNYRVKIEEIDGKGAEYGEHKDKNARKIFAASEPVKPTK